MRLWFWRKQQHGPAPAESASPGDTSDRITQRQFLRMLVTAAGGASLGLTATRPRPAAAEHHSGNPDWVDNSLNVQGNLTVDDKMGIGAAVPSQGRLNVAGAIYVNGAVAISSGGIAMQSYYVAVEQEPTSFDPGEWGVARSYDWGDFTSSSWTWAYLQTLTAP